MAPGAKELESPWARQFSNASSRTGVRLAFFYCALLRATTTRVYLDAAYAIKDWFVWPTLLLWFYNAVLFAAFTSAGMRVLRWLRVRGPQLEQFAFAVPIGCVVFCLGMYVIGSIGLFSLWPAVILALLLLASGAGPTWHFARRAIGGWPAPDLGNDAVLRRGIRLLALGYGALCLILLYLTGAHSRKH